ncbi:MAG: hypothetical protein OXU61_13985 [Gammaproteobacteria bacterium]|nr:hypothetical protein [Gammaproteobacteria bacterium]
MTPSARRPRQNSTTPVLSQTLIRARFTGEFAQRFSAVASNASSSNACSGAFGSRGVPVPVPGPPLAAG